MKKTIKHDYTGFAVANQEEDTPYLIGKEYNKIGIYTPCLRLENGVAVALGIGGFSEESVNSELCKKEHYPVLVYEP